MATPNWAAEQDIRITIANIAYCASRLQQPALVDAIKECDMAADLAVYESEISNILDTAAEAADIDG